MPERVVSELEPIGENLYCIELALGSDTNVGRLIVGLPEPA